MNNGETPRRETLGLGMRLVLLGVMALVLLLASMLIYPLVKERMDNAEQAKASIALPWGKKQTIGGPMIVVPFAVAVKENGGDKLEVNQMVFIPDSLEIDVKVDPEVRARGIYKALLYRAEAIVTGNFVGVRRSKFPANTKVIYWEEATLRYGVSDIVGLKSFVKCEAGDNSYVLDKVTSETPRSLSFSSALESPIDSALVEEGFAFRLTVALNGNESLCFCPMGRTTDVMMRLHWGNPSFGGRFLPDIREVTDSLTTARWKVLSINHQIPENFLMRDDGVRDDDSYSYRDYSVYSGEQDDDNIATNEFAVRLLQPVSHYKQVDRSVKYAILLIVFTFLTIFFCDYFAKKHIPLFAFLLVGVAVLLFYTFLLSLSELMGFGWAYIISCVAVVGLATTYLYGFLRDKVYTMIGGGVMVLLYGMMYLLLTLENLPLLIGSIFLFIVLAIIMRLSLKMHW